MHSGIVYVKEWKEQNSARGAAQLRCQWIRQVNIKTGDIIFLFLGDYVFFKGIFCVGFVEIYAGIPPRFRVRHAAGVRALRTNNKYWYAIMHMWSRRAFSYSSIH